MKQKNSFSHFPQRRINLLFASFLGLAFLAISADAVGAKDLPAPAIEQLKATEKADTDKNAAASTGSGSDIDAKNGQAQAGGRPALPGGETLALPGGGTPAGELPGQKEKQSTSSTYDDVTVEQYQFGVVTDHSGATKDWKLHPVVVIPNLPGIQYAWKLKLNKSNPVFVREEFTLPEAPSSWKIKDGETSSQLLNGGEECVLESFQTTDGGWIGHSWSASLGDPPGRYQIKIWLNGKLARIFTFNVGEPTESDRQKRDI